MVSQYPNSTDFREGTNDYNQANDLKLTIDMKLTKEKLTGFLRRNNGVLINRNNQNLKEAMNMLDAIDDFKIEKKEGDDNKDSQKKEEVEKALPVCKTLRWWSRLWNVIKVSIGGDRICDDTLKQ